MQMSPASSRLRARAAAAHAPTRGDESRFQELDKVIFEDVVKDSVRAENDDVVGLQLQLVAQRGLVLVGPAPTTEFAEVQGCVERDLTGGRAPERRRPACVR